MDSSIHAPTQPTHDWDTLRRDITSSFLDYGACAGDDPDLMLKKATRAYALIRDIVEKTPIEPFKWTPPPGLPSLVAEELDQNVQRALRLARVSTTTHLVHLLVPSLYDLCSSILSVPPPNANS